jgi:glycine cleavage system H lipoate-binding protein
MNAARRDLLCLGGGAAAGVVFTPVPWKLLDDVSIWTQNWRWLPVPPRGEITRRYTGCTMCGASHPLRRLQRAGRRPNGFDCRHCAGHPKFATGVETAPRYNHRGHTWVEVGEGGVCTAGLDEIASRLLSEAETVDLPAPGTAVENNGPGWRVRKAGSDVRVLAPVDGEVVETGGPDKGWFLKIKPRLGQPDLRHLLRGAEVRAWMACEMDRLQLMLPPQTMADGGELVDDPVKAQPEANWDRVFGAMLLDP